ncbi:MAG TPA: glycosyltransferase 87 family protein [Chthoniobacterales bacterium]|nr:glycosyltransferase 87 family protein [Chthoniobacterales bacterium]
MTEHRAPTRGLRIALIAFLVVAATFAFFPIANALIPGKSIKDYELWYDTGQRMLHGEPIYPLKRSGKFPFMYPPAAAAMLAPLSALGQIGFILALLAITAAAWFASIALAARLASGSWRRAHLLVYVIPSLLVIVFVWSNFHIGQPTLVLLALLLGAFVALQEKRQMLAGALIAVAAAIKAFPFVAIAYLVWRRYWIATVSLLVTLALLLFVLPAPFRGLAQASADVKRWTEGMLLKYDEEGVAQRPGRSNSWKNQSIFGLANRLLRHVDADDQVNPHTPVYVNLVNLDFAVVNRIIIAVGLMLGLIYVAVMPRRQTRTGQTDALEFALFILLMLMFTPLSFGYLFACLLFPFAVVVQRLLAAPTRSLLICAAGSVVLLALSIPFQRPAQLYGNYFFAALLLFVGLAMELWQARRLAAVAEDSTREDREPAHREERRDAQRHL